jgi:hypothetical protein
MRWLARLEAAIIPRRCPVKGGLQTVLVHSLCLISVISLSPAFVLIEYQQYDTSDVEHSMEAL